MAATTYWARFVHGNKRLRIDEEPFALAQSFSPPAIGRAVQYSEAGRGKSGGKRVLDRFADHAWNFNVRIQGDTEAEVLGYIRRLSSFLELASDKQFPLQFEYYPYSATGCIPLWGQGVYRYTIKDGSCTTISPWLVRDKFAIVAVNMRIAPVVEGQRQRVALARGGIYEDTIKTPNGESRGVQVCTAGTNVMTNPIFSHATWNTGWTAGTAAIARVIETKITDQNIVLFGDTCALIQHGGTASTGTALYTTTMTTAAATYVMSAHVRLLDGRAPGTADMQLWCRGTALGAFNTISVGDNWYRIWDTATCPAAAGTAGIRLMNPGLACYVDGFQMEAALSSGTVVSPLMHGDALGCAWSGTRGASTTVRTVGMLKLPVTSETVDTAGGAFRVVLKWGIASTGLPAADLNYRILSAASATYNGLGLSFNTLAKTINFEPANIAGVSFPQSAALTFAMGDISIIYATWGRTSDGQDQVALYADTITGVATDTLALSEWTPDLYIGSYGGTVQHIPAKFLDMTIFDHYLTAAEVAADYAQVSAHVNGGDGLGHALNRIPYIWTKDGDNVIDTVSDATRDNFCVAHGIPGNLPAHTVFDMQATFNSAGNGGLVISNLPYRDYLDMTNLYNITTSGTQGVGTVTVNYPPGGTVIALTRQLEAYRNKNAYILATIWDEGTTYCRGRMKITYDTATNAYYSDYKSLATDGTAAWFIIGPMIIPDTMPSVYDWMAGYGELNINLELIRTSGTANIVVNSIMVMPGDFLYVPVDGLTAGHAIIIDEKRGYSYSTSTSKEDGMVTLYGKEIDLIPGVYNHLVVVAAAVARDADFSDTTTISRAYVTPRYSLL